MARGAIERTQRATALLQRSVKVHHDEMRGLVNRNDAIEQTVRLNDLALIESDKALQIMRELLHMK